jgi:dTDP-4-dehydrorhamnose reductase
MRILLFGANGQVGTELRRSLAPLGEIVPTTRSGLLPDGQPCVAADFDAPQALPALVEQLAPDIVVNAAAYTAVDRAEGDMAAAFRANADAPARIAAACAARNAMLVHYSTDYVFDGSETRPYREEDPVNPLGVYGASKLAGERAIQASGARHLIFRTAWVYAAHGHNFLRTMLRLAAERDELRVVSDQIGAPTPAALIADATAGALQRPATRSGLWHLVAGGQASWHGFAEAIFAGACARGLIARTPRVIPITTSDYPTPARRPAWSVLDTSRLQQDFELRPAAWQDGLGKVLDEIVRAGGRMP